MNKSESIKELAAALAKAQSEIKGALKDQANPFFKNKYADLGSVVEAIRAPLAKYGLAYTQLTEPSEKDEVRVETVILHSSGEWISSLLALPVSKVDAQGFGSALTYARRYGLSAAFGVAPEDDDGNAAAKAAPDVARQVARANVKPNADAGKGLTPEQKQRIETVSSEVIDCFEAGRDDTAFDVIEEANLDNEEKLFLWTFLGSSIRSALKRISAARQATKLKEMESTQA